MGPHYWCDAFKDDVLAGALGSADVARVVTDEFYCQIVVRRYKASGIYNSHSVYLSPYESGHAAFDRFVEPNELGDVTADHADAERRVRLAIDALMAYDEA